MFEFVIKNDYELKCPFCEVICFYTPKDIKFAQEKGYIECKSCKKKISDKQCNKY